jgi:hypothetical protein
MTQQYVPNLGQLIEGEAFRDAVHIAVAPLIACQDLAPGVHFGLRSDNGQAFYADAGDPKAVGIVDPFLRVRMVKEGQRFWGFLYPQTVTSLRHAWSHPSFKAKIPEVNP